MKPTPTTTAAPRIMFAYWGRRGLTRFTRELANTARANANFEATISLSRENENFAGFADLGDALFPVHTFTSDAGALTQAWRLPALRRQIARRLAEDRTTAVIELMPHVWSWAVAAASRDAGARYLTIVHDAEAHRGDYRTRPVKFLIDRAMARADTVITLSQAVTDRLIAGRRLPAERIATLFHPDLGGGAHEPREPPRPGEPFRLLWLGRIMPYKGLALLLDAVELVKAAGHLLDISVLGEGPLGAEAPRLAALGAKVVNRWLSEDEIAAAVRHHHAIVLSHTHASQSGIAATALGAGLPSIATPVGGLPEQIVDGRTGILAARADAEALAAAIVRLIADASLYRAISANLAATRQTRSMASFVSACLQAALADDPSGIR